MQSLASWLHAKTCRIVCVKEMLEMHIVALVIVYHKRHPSCLGSVLLLNINVPHGRYGITLPHLLVKQVISCSRYERVHPFRTYVVPSSVAVT